MMCVGRSSLFGKRERRQMTIKGEPHTYDLICCVVMVFQQQQTLAETCCNCWRAAHVLPVIIVPQHTHSHCILIEQALLSPLHNCADQQQQTVPAITEYQMA